MKAKNILSIAAFFTAFAVSAALASLFLPANTTNYRATSCFTNHSKSADAISELIRQDVSNGNQRDRKIYRDKENIPLVIEDYVNASNSLNASELPRDFQIAWRKHMKAWHDYSNFLNNIESSRYEDSGVESFAGLEAGYMVEIDETWYEVLRVARNHGSHVRGY